MCSGLCRSDSPTRFSVSPLLPRGVTPPSEQSTQYSDRTANPTCPSVSPRGKSVTRPTSHNNTLTLVLLTQKSPVFWALGPSFLEDNFSMDGSGMRGDLGMIQAHYIYCVLYFYYYYYIGSTSDHQALGPGGWGPLYLLTLGMAPREKPGRPGSLRFMQEWRERLSLLQYCQPG